MKIEATSGGRKESLSDTCSLLKLKGESKDEQAFLSKLFFLFQKTSIQYLKIKLGFQKAIVIETNEVVKLYDVFYWEEGRGWFNFGEEISEKTKIFFLVAYEKCSGVYSASPDIISGDRLKLEK